MSQEASHRWEEPTRVDRVYQLVEAACVTLTNHRRSEVAAISLVLPLPSEPEEAEELGLLIERLGEEYDLRQLIRRDGMLLTVRFTQDPWRDSNCGGQ